jgi:hypothetical protein
MDRRYRQAAGASRSASNQQQALVRARLARARMDARSARGGGNEQGPKSIDPYAAVSILRARSMQEADRERIFQEEGSGTYGAAPSLEEARRRGDQSGGLLPGFN